MKLFTRLIESGVFIFWSDDENDTIFNLKIRITVGDKKIILVDMNPAVGQNYYSFDRVGSGEYEIELNGFRNNTLYQTEIKNIKIISSVERGVENFQSLLDSLAALNNGISSIDNSISNIDTNIIDLYNLLLKVEEALTDPRTIMNIRREVKEYERVFG